MTALLSLNSEAQQVTGKLKTARKDIAEAKYDLKQAQKDSIAEYKQFRAESLAKVEENNKTIEALRARKIEKEKIATAEYNKKVKALEDTNRSLKDRVTNYRADGNTNWVVFKRQFNQQMTELQQSFKESRD